MQALVAGVEYGDRDLNTPEAKMAAEGIEQAKGRLRST